MKKQLLTTVAALGALTAFTVAGQAADLIEEPVYVEPVPVAPVPISTAGWYLRGDVGYVFSDSTRGRYIAPRAYYDFDSYKHDYFGQTYGYDRVELDDSFIVGGGVGYRFNDFARFDVTADYFSSDIEGTSNCVDLPSKLCRYDDRSEADIWMLMANAYADLGTYGIFTPYVGASLGAAHVDYSDLKNKFDCSDSFTPYFDGCGETRTHHGESSWRFAYGLAAGASIDITRQLKLDAGYRWTHINDGEAFGFDAEDRALGYDGTQGYDEGFDIHTIRAGLRYEFGGGGFGKGKAPVAPVYAEPVPVYQDVVYK